MGAAARQHHRRNSTARQRDTIVKALDDHGPASATVLEVSLGYGQSTVTECLADLRDSRVVEVIERKGRSNVFDLLPVHRTNFSPDGLHSSARISRVSGPARQAVLDALRTEGPMTAVEIVIRIGGRKTTVNEALRTLAYEGLVCTKRRAHSQSEMGRAGRLWELA